MNTVRRLRLAQNAASSLFAAFAVLVCSPFASADDLIPTGATWQYWDSATSPKPNWYVIPRKTDQWLVGPGPFGAGEDGVSTTVAAGGESQGHTSFYFRRQFELDDTSTDGVIYLRVDDGCVVYVNGREVYRFNVADGKLSHGSRARLSMGGIQETLYHRVLLSRKLLRKGNNIIGVSIHQVAPGNKDLFFDLRFERRDALPLFSPKLRGDAQLISQAYQLKNYLGPEDKIPNGFLDGGSSMEMGEGDVVSSEREIVLVDRRNDPTLRKYIEIVKSPYISKLAPMERARRIAMFVDGEFSPKAGREYAFLSSLYLKAGYAGQAVPLGDVRSLGGGGEARHRAVLFKLLGDAAGLDVALARGARRALSSDSKSASGVHVWNELWVGDQCHVVDLTVPGIGFVFPEAESSSVEKYRTAAGQAFYQPRGEKQRES